MMLNRRQILQLSAAAGAGAAVSAAHGERALAADEFDALRLRWIEKTLRGTGYNPADEPFATMLGDIGTAATGFRGTMSPAAGSLWPDLPIGSVSANVSASYSRLKQMTQAWAFPGTGLTADAGLLSQVIAGLDWMHANAYNPSTTSYNNWWDWQVGSSRFLLDTTCLVYDALTAGQKANYLASIDHFVPDAAVASYSGASTGANRVDLCRVLIIRGVLGKNSAKISLGRDALSPVFPLVRNGDGWYSDGSFIQHTNVPYTGTYGHVLVGGLANLMALLAGSSWPVTDANRQVIFDAVTKGIAPYIFNGLMMDCQSGRAISRGIRELDNPLQLQQDDHVRGHSYLGSILLLAEAASAVEAAQWKAIVKGWLQRDYWSPLLNDQSQTLPTLSLSKIVLGDSSVTAAAEPVQSKIFGSMDRATHRRPTWAAAISMCSGRTAFTECANGENLRGWHLSSGMTYWWGNTYGNGQYSDAYWPTVDPYRLPGTTVSRKPLADGQGGSRPTPPASATWTGGATNGTYSAIGQDVRGVASTLAGRKAWFCLDDQIVCLGAAIAATEGFAVETTIDNRNLGASSSAGLTVDGVAQPATLGWSGTFAGASWAAIAGFAGYVFPTGATLKATREARTGAWKDINTTASATPITRRYLTLWLDHGTNPANGSYSYILLPGFSAAATASRAASPTVTVLANTGAVQAITDTATGVTAANFYAPGTAGPITVSAPCSVLMRESGGTLSVSVADPTRASTTITVTIDRQGFTSATGDSQMNVVGLNPLTLVVETGGCQGASCTITLGTGSPVTAGQHVILSPAADAYVRDGSYAATNYGSTTDLVIKNASSGYHRRSFLKFDIASLASPPRRAVLWVHGNTADSAGTQANIHAYAVSNDSWSEATVNWNNQPPLSSTLSSAAVGSIKDWIPLDVTSHVQAQFAADKVASIGLAQPNAGLAIVLHSRNNGSAQPFLQIITGG